MPLARLARETEVGLRTLERWHARYRADGYAGLETASRADTGTRRLPPDLVDLIEGLALSKPRPAIATIHRKVTGICATRRWPVPSYSVVWDIVRTLDPGMVTLALEGAASYRDKHELVLRRQAELPNAMWQSDHTLCYTSNVARHITASRGFTHAHRRCESGGARATGRGAVPVRKAGTLPNLRTP